MAKRRAKAQNYETVQTSFDLKKITPLTENQRKTFSYYNQGKNLLLHGCAGTGKTFLSIYLAMQEVLAGTYKKLVIFRSVVPTRDIGFMPGTMKDKIRVYEKPYESIFAELFGRGDSYNYFKQKLAVEFECTSFVRGTTLSDCIVIVDEVSNLSFHECDSLITRVGPNCKIILAGDFTQSDLSKEIERAGFREFMKIVKKMPSFAFVDFKEEDIVRSGIVKEYIITKNRELELSV